jgi:hypothetical protein
MCQDREPSDVSIWSTSSGVLEPEGVPDGTRRGLAGSHAGGGLYGAVRMKSPSDGLMKIDGMGFGCCNVGPATSVNLGRLHDQA